NRIARLAAIVGVQRSALAGGDRRAAGHGGAFRQDAAQGRPRCAHRDRQRKVGLARVEPGSDGLWRRLRRLWRIRRRKSMSIGFTVAVNRVAAYSNVLYPQILIFVRRRFDAAPVQADTQELRTT